MATFLSKPDISIMRDIMKPIINYLAKKLVQYPKPIIAVIIVLTITFAIFLHGIDFDTDIINYYPKSNVKLKLFKKINKKFGGGGLAILTIPDKHIFSIEKLAMLKRISQKMRHIKLDLNTLYDKKALDHVLSLVDFIPDEISQNKHNIAKIKGEILGNSFYVGKIINKSGDIAAIILNFSEEAAKDNSVIDQIFSIIEKEEINEYYIAGLPLLSYYIEQYMTTDLLFLIPIVALLIVLTLFYCFRTLLGVILPLITVFISTIWTVGLMTISGIDLNLLNTAVPVIIMAIGSAYGIHLVSKYYEEMLLSDDKETIIYNTSSQISLPIIMSGLTTMVGFLSLLTAEFTPIKTFGIASAIGVFFSCMITIILIPACLCFFKLKIPNSLIGKNKKLKKTFVIKFLDILTETVYKQKKIIILGVVCLSIIWLFLLPLLKTQSDPFSYFDESSKLKQSYEFINEHFGGSQAIQILMKGDMKDPQTLKTIQQFQQHIASMKNVSQPVSIVDVVREINKRLNKKAQLPETREEMEKIYPLILLGSLFKGSEMISKIISSDLKESLLQFQISTADSQEVAKIIDNLENYIRRNIPKTSSGSSLLDCQITGMPVIFLSIDKGLLNDQLVSILLAVFLVFFLLSAEFRSFKTGLISLTPIIFTILTCFAIMSMFKIRLDIATFMIASITIGIGIDYVIHFQTRFSKEMSSGSDMHSALLRDFETTGKAILFNTLSVSFGFIVLIFGNFVPQRILGGMIALTMLLSSFSSLLILPSLNILLKINNKKSS